MLRRSLETLAIIIAIVAVWKAFGGNPEAIVTAAWDWITGIIDSASNWVNEQGLLNWLK